jgi:hypothetical protein
MIKPGECVLSETALMVVSRQPASTEPIFWSREFGAVGSGASNPGYVATIAPEVNRLNATTRTAFDGLMIHPQHSHFTTPQQMVPRFKVNAFHDYERGSGGVQGRYHYAVFKDISRVNHSCRPNAAVNLSWRTRVSFTVGGRVQKPTGTIRALTPMATGEEITIDYLGHYPEGFSAVGPRGLGFLESTSFSADVLPVLMQQPLTLVDI